MIIEKFFPTHVYGKDVQLDNNKLAQDIINWSNQDKGVEKTNYKGWHSTTDMGDKPEYEDLNITFIVDEFLENYISMHEWMIGTGFPKNRTQFANFRSNTANQPQATLGTSTDIGDTQPATPDKGMYGDATLTILSNKNNPLVEVRFQDVFPTSLGGLSYTQTATDVEYLTVDATFQYKIYEIVTL